MITILRMSVTDSDAGHLEGEGKSKERKRTKKERKRTNLGPRIKVLRLVTGEELEETESVEMDEAAKSGVKVECQMETSKQKTVTFEFHTTDIVPEEMASTFINEVSKRCKFYFKALTVIVSFQDLLAEEHRTILVEQLHDIVTQLANNPDQLPTVSFPPEECFSPTRDKRDPSSEAAKTEHQPQPPAEPQHQPQPEPPQAAQPPVRGTEKPPEKVKRFQISPVVENKPIVPTTFPVTPGSSIVSVDKRDNSTITVAGAKIDTATSPTTPAYVENKTKLEKLEMNRPMTISASSGLTTTLSPGAEQQQVTKPALVMSASSGLTTTLSPGAEQQQVTKPALVMSGSTHSQAQVSPGSTIGTSVTSPETNGAAPTHHPLTVAAHASSNVSDLEANLAMVFNTKIPAPSLPTAAPVPASNVPGIVPLGVGLSSEQAGLQQPHQAEVSSDHLTVASDPDQGASNTSTVHSTKSLDDGLGEPVKQSTPVVTPDKAHDAAASSRFAVKRVEDITVSSGPSHVPEEPELTEINMSGTNMVTMVPTRADYQRVAAEAEHYDSSPSPGSCYDTASESVEPNMMGPGQCPNGQPQLGAVTQTLR